MTIDETAVARARTAVSVLFVVNALGQAIWAARLIDIQRSLGVNALELGSTLAAYSVGGIIVGPLAGVLVHRWGSARVTIVSGVAYMATIPFVGFATTSVVLAGVFLLGGAVDATMDSAMNAHALRVQKRYSRSIINAFHGFWSVGTVIGGVVGAVTGALAISLGWTLTAASIASIVAIFVVAKQLLPGDDPHSHVPDQTSGGRRQVSGVLLLLGLFTLLAVVIEVAPPSWSSVYLTGIGAPAFLVGAGFVAFTAAQTTGRFVADRLVDAFGEPAVIRTGMAASAVALGAALLTANPWAFIAASFIVGFAVAPLFPSAMRAAAHIPGVRPAMGVATVGWMARGGFGFAPIIVGAVINAHGVGWGMAMPILAAVALIPLASLLGPSGRRHSATDD